MIKLKNENKWKNQQKKISTRVNFWNLWPSFWGSLRYEKEWSSILNHPNDKMMKLKKKFTKRAETKNNNKKIRIKF